MKKTLLTLAITSAISSAVISPVTFAHEHSNNTHTDADEVIVVTANRSEQNSIDVLSSVQVITRADIELSAASSIVELLNTVNGIQLSQSGGAGQKSGIFSRGTNAGHTLVIIDGQRVSSATLGQVEFANLAPEQIERIEVIKGPRAALWGSDAIGGVIQIFTRQLNAGEVAFDLGLGNNGQKQASISTALAHGDGATTFTASAKSSDGYDVLASAEKDDDGYNRENISLIGFQTLNQQWRINWLAKYNQGESEYDNAYGGANENSFETHQWQLSAQQNAGEFSQQFSLGQQQNKTVDFGNGLAEKDGDSFETTRLQVNWLGSYQLTKELTSNTGLDFIDEEVKTTTTYEQTQRDIKAVFARLAYDNSSIILDGTVRYDDIEGIDSEVTYNLSAGLYFAENSIVSLNMGSGFKAPSFNDLYYPKSIYSYGNADLTAETSDSIELLVKSSLTAGDSEINAELSIYQTKIDNLIEWVPDASFAWRPININKAKIEGVELTLVTDYLGFNHQLQFNYLDAIDDNTGDELIRRAKRTASYQLTYNWGKLDLLANVNYQGKREDSKWPGTITLPSHTLVNLSASYQLNDTWKLGFKANNVFDKNYQTNYGYIGQPAQYLLTVSYRR